MQNLLKTCGLLLILAVSWSCDEDMVMDQTAPALFDKERVDLVLESGSEVKVHAEGMNDLIDISYNQPYWYYENERKLSIDLGGGSMLKLIVRDAGQINPFQAGNRYSTYPFSLMEDRNTYMIAQYINKGILQYATTRSGGPSLIQTNVLEIRRVLDNGFSARINQLVLDKVAITDDGRAFSGENLSVNGTFIAIFD